MTKSVSVAGNTMFELEAAEKDCVLIMDALGRIRDKTPMAVKGAINETQKELTKFLVKQSSKKYIAKQSEIKGSIKNTKAKTGRLEAVIKSISPMTELYQRKISDKELHWPFNSSARPEFIKGKVIRAANLEKLRLRPGAKDEYRAFVARFTNRSKSGEISEHITVAQRVPGKRMKSKPWKEALKKLLAPADPMMVGKVYDEADTDVSGMLNKHIESNLDRYIKL